MYVLFILYNVASKERLDLQYWVNNTEHIEWELRMGATRIFSLSRRSSELLVASAVSQILIVELVIHEERADRFDLRHVEQPVGVRVSHIEQVVRRLKCLLLVAQPDL